ncbi:MAG: tetratricopeptide repeat protein, partial [Gemmatimonadales bacterium]
MIRYAAFILALAVGATTAGAQQVLPWHRLDLDSLSRATVADSDDAVVQYHNALAFWDRKKYDEADSLLRRAMKLAPEYADAQLAFSILPLARGDRYLEDLNHRLSKDSMAAFVREMNAASRRAFLLDPGVDLSVLARAGDHYLPQPRGSLVLQTPRGPVFIRTGDPWWFGPLKKGAHQLVAGQPEEAFKTLDDALHRKEMQEPGAYLGDDFVWWYALAAFHVHNYDRAVSALLTLVQRASDREATASSWSPPQARPDFEYLLATALYLGNAYDRADSSFRAALDLDLGLYMAHVQMARIAEARGDLAGAAIERQRAIDTNPEEGGLYVDLGATLLRA